MSDPRSTDRMRWLPLALLLAAAWWVFDLAVLHAGIPDRLDDTWEYGLVARALLAGHGFRTPLIHPPLWPLHDAAMTVPVLVHGPLMPVLLAPWIALFGDRALDHIAWLGALGATATIVPLFRLGSRYGHAAIGFAAALLWTLSPLTLHAVHHDAVLCVGAALVLAALELATRPDPRPVAAGVAMGLASLARPELGVALPLLALLTPRGHWVMLGSGAAVTAPWSFHHWLAVRLPFFNLSSTLVLGFWPPWEGLSPMRTFALTPDRFASTLAAAWPAILHKWAAWFPHVVKSAVLQPTGGTGWIAVLGLLLALADRRTRASALRLAPFAAIPITVMTLTLPDLRYLVPLLPLWTLAVARGAYGLASRLPAWAQRPGTWIVLLLLSVAPVTAAAVREEAGLAPGLAARLVSERIRAAAWLAEAEAARPASRQRLAFSDTPDFLAWTTRWPVVWVVPEQYAVLPTAGSDLALPVRAGRWESYFHPEEPGLSR